ncbi:hydroxypyruvate isomerase family protein [Phaeovulum vinaykumarii]|uniref:Hydroxypyruvate isomerase n=1 Tax=Phaeovulum vinaykumarii TaxID=407234 RepID=A0A1N7M8Y5_9RHOB|nr:TIM barrel protein [Phaeovulum vinaykumarii]SIS82431.1 hydroxypyruvate isomerase [Phaeovulum vinaykumarii]SOC10988.1 hydroxypyruvate isomerase [Phaeovulum vinaykumarii]
MLFSANLGFLFRDRPLPEAVSAARRHGFDAVECHWPYDTPAEELRTALIDADFRMQGLNTRPGDVAAGEFGLAALPGAVDRARAAIDEAIAYAAAIGAGNVHVMAGRSDGGIAAEDTFRANLDHACRAAAERGLSILIEPINLRDVAGYHLSRAEHAAEIITALGHANLKMMFDCYHLQIMQGDLTRLFEKHAAMVGHVQIAAVPDRGEPDAGELNYPDLLAAILRAGFTAPVGAEYKPRSGDTEAGLGWLPAFRKIGDLA